MHVEETAEVLVCVLLADAPKHRLYNAGGTTVSLFELVEVVRLYIPDARIAFERETGGRTSNGTCRLANSRLVGEFGLTFRWLSNQVSQVIDDVWSPSWSL